MGRVAEYLRQLDVFCGELSFASARVYARIAGIEDPSGLTLRGSVRGPLSKIAATLPVTVPLMDLGPGDSLLARAVVTDPCCWSPQAPSIYSVNVEVWDNDTRVAAAERTLGIRHVATRGASLFWESKRWVLRGVHRADATGADVGAWRDASAVMLAETPDDDLCRQASELGVVMVVTIGGSDNDTADRLRHWAQWPAVAIVVLDGIESNNASLRAAAPNLLLGQRFAADAEVEPAQWAHLVVCEVADVDQFAEKTATLKLPIVAVRRLGHDFNVETGRAACDRLQRDLARHGDFAGYCALPKKGV